MLFRSVSKFYRTEFSVAQNDDGIVFKKSNYGGGDRSIILSLYLLKSGLMLIKKLIFCE